MNLQDYSWGLVLAGGGGKGSYEVGAFRAIEEYGLRDKIIGISGASIGGINMAIWECGNAETAAQAWSEVSPEYFVEIDPELNGRTGFSRRDGLIKMLAKYVNLDILRECPKDLYVSVTDYGPNMVGEGTVKYYRLNGGDYDRIKDLILATSALPVLYEPVKIDGGWCRDGGLRDNTPIQPLYIEGIRHFIVVGLKPDMELDLTQYPDAEFLIVKPEISIGQFFDGTIDFTPEGAKVRMELGYLDTVRAFRFWGRDLNDPATRAEYEEAIKLDYMKHNYTKKATTVASMVSKSIGEIDSLLTRYGVKKDD